MKAGENENFEFHVDYTTKHIDGLLNRVDRNGISLSDHKCYHAISKNDDTETYVVMDVKKEPVLICDSPYEMECAILSYRFELAYRMDITHMAESRDIPRVV